MAVVDRISSLQGVREKIEANERLDLEDGLALIESDDLLALGELADLARRQSEPERIAEAVRKYLIRLELRGPDDSAIQDGLLLLLRLLVSLVVSKTVIVQPWRRLPR
mgnify:CR=1 FL=1